MIYMLDTNICSFIIRERPLTVKEKLKIIDINNNKVVLSSIVASELLYGAYKIGSPKLIDTVKTFIDFFEVLPFDLSAAEEYGKIRSFLEKKGIVIGAYDLQIAAHARSINAILVTNNIEEFSRVEGLKIEDWTK
ncbi:MAG TPA: type II toxin-antitoxin system VapC family toxin [Persephonella sp.]|uniref:Ribonuclease VapC n=1 Tax=Persephonella marina (strain DSM 14350 / EX-H1) TaxID=123214 RepID=C0QSI5_PERMH|nr:MULTISPECIES: type II toxin-antitoxin system VapC family toxin [Persephonella]ACO04316.1 PilT protein domain protein [Persephonella marina EX-H1]HCB69377.1 type II toxin-antitoxin system VapC family toxin [Persephonella sp.]